MGLVDEVGFQKSPRWAKVRARILPVATMSGMQEPFQELNTSILAPSDALERRNHR